MYKASISSEGIVSISCNMQLDIDETCGVFTITEAEERCKFLNREILAKTEQVQRLTEMLVHAGGRRAAIEHTIIRQTVQGLQEMGELTPVVVPV